MHKPSSCTPGPGNYSIPTEFGRQKGANVWTMKAKHRDPVLRDEKPGPARYDLPDQTFKGGLEYSLSAKRKPMLLRDEGPGPGAYKVRETSEKIKTKIATGFGPAPPLSKKQANAFVVPGPGAYRATESFLTSQPYQGVSYSLSGRLNHPGHAKDVVPGPGMYKVQYGPKESGLQYSFRGRYNIPAKNFTPGPGMYDPKSQVSGPGYSFARRFLQFDSQFANQQLAKEHTLRGYNDVHLGVAPTQAMRPFTAR